jgi:hypothetical protein
VRANCKSLNWNFCCVLPLAILLFLSASSANAQTSAPNTTPVVGTTDWDQWKRNCSLSEDFLKKFISCATSTFTARPFHFLAQSIVPGSGVGGGGRYSADLNEKNGAQDQLQATSVITIREFWFAELKFNTTRAIVGDWNKSGESLFLNIYARNRSMPTMPFYGIGPNTNVNNSVKFSQRDTSAGIEITTPFPEVSWLSAGGTLEGLWPSVGGVSGTNIVSSNNTPSKPHPGWQRNRHSFTNSYFFGRTSAFWSALRSITLSPTTSIRTPAQATTRSAAWRRTWTTVFTRKRRNTAA